MLNENLHKVSCVMVTTGRYDLIKRSIACFLGQTYPNKELIIVSQGNVSANRLICDYVKSLNDRNVLFVEAPDSLCLGSMRNLSIELTTGEVICQWDDDDIYHPHRITSQYKCLMSNSCIGSFYSEFLKYFVDSGDLYCCNWSKEHLISHRYLCGTAMFFKSAFYEYENLLYPEEGDQCCVEEDLNVLEKLLVKGNIISPMHGFHYVYVYHGENTYDLNHHKLGINTSWKKTIAEKDKLLSMRNDIEEVLSFGGIKEKVFVRSEKELAFTFSP